MLYFTERGRTLFARNEEVWSWCQARKVFEITPCDQDGDLCIFALEHEANTRPLKVRVGDTEAEVAAHGPFPGRFLWRRIVVPARELRGGRVEVVLSCEAPSMTGWILAVDATGSRGASHKSVDRGKTWRAEGMGYDSLFAGEYLVRLWTPGGELRHPDLPFVHEKPNHPRLAELRGFLAERMDGLPAGEDFGRATALMHWLSMQWPHMNGSLGAAYAAWDALTILDWTRNARGHTQPDLIAFCVHYAVAFVQFATALGLEARMTFSQSPDDTGPGGHCMPEVYCRDLGKWVLFDPDVDAVPTLDGEPLGALELHKIGRSARAGEMCLKTGPRFAAKSDLIRGFWRDYWPRDLYARWGFLPRNDFFSHPEAFLCEHGRTVYHQTDILWYRSETLDPLPWFPYHSDDDEDFVRHCM